MQITLLQRLQAQNEWWRDPNARLARNYPVRRVEFAEARKRLLDRTGPQVLLSGPRQVGKTVLLWQLADSLLADAWPREGLVYFRLEDAAWPRGAAPRLEEIVTAHRKAFPNLSDGQCIYLFDEVGESPRWDVGLKHLHERRAGRFAATDSAAGLLAGQRETAGRYLDLKIPFLSFTDFVRFRGGGDLSGNEAQELDAYLVRGGSPFQATMQDAALARETIRERFRKSLFLDLSRIAGFRQPDKAEALFVALVADSGTVFSAKKRGEEDLGLPRQTVDRWLRALEGTGLLRRLLPWSPGARSRARAPGKVYAADPGLVSAFSVTAWPLEDATPRGRILETAAHSHLQAFALRTGADLTYFGDGTDEADFVLRGRTHGLAIQATAGKDSSPGDAHSAARVARKLGRVVPAVVSRHPFEVEHETNGERVKEVPLWALCERLESATSVEEIATWLRC